MKTASFTLREEHIEWLKQKAVQAEFSTSSQVLRRILTEAMERDGANPAFMIIHAGDTTPANPAA